MKSCLRILVLGVFATAACGSTVESNGGDGGGSSAKGGDAAGANHPTGGAGMGGGDEGAGAENGEGKVPPKPGAEKPGDGSDARVFAVSELYMGETTRDGDFDDTAWRSFGFNLDGMISKEGVGHCQPVKGASADVVEDGDEGIDNSFGHNMLPVISKLAGTFNGGQDLAFSGEVTKSIHNGQFTLLLEMADLGTGADYNPLLVRGYAGASLGHPGAWDGSDKWPIAPELLADPADLHSTKISFPKSYLVNNTWVSSTETPTVQLQMDIMGASILLNVHHAVFAMDLAKSHEYVQNGTLAGVLDTKEFVAGLKTSLEPLVAGLGAQGCSALSYLATQIEKMSDIMADGTQNPDKTCDGISIGLGYDMIQAKLGAVADPAPPVEGGNCK